MATLHVQITHKGHVLSKHFLQLHALHLKKFIALARVSGDEPGGDFVMGAARAKWPLNIMQME